MSEILQQWLCTRLGVILDMDPQFFGDHIRDGTLLAQLLHSYDIINREQLEKIAPTDEPSQCFKNLKCIQAWLKIIDMECKDSFLQDMAEGKGHIAIRLVYQLFLCLEDKDRLHFITGDIDPHKQSTSRMRFDVQTVSDSDLKKETSADELPMEYLSKEKDDLIQWYEEKYLGLIEQIKMSRASYNERVKSELTSKSVEEDSSTELVPENISEEAAIDDQLLLEVESKDDLGITYEMLMEEKMRAEAYRNCTFVDEQQAKVYMNYLKKRRKKESAHQAFKLRMQRMLLAEQWGKLIDAQEKSFDEFISLKLLKQSQYEKQIATKLLHIRHEKKIMAENRLMVEKLMNEKREEEFNKALLSNQDVHDKEMEDIEFERARTLELHQRLYAEKMARRQEKHLSMCHDIMLDIADIAIKFDDYKLENEGVVPTKILDEWKALFFKSLPLFTDAESEKDSLVDDSIEEILAPSSEVELMRQEVQNEHDLEQYLEFAGPWNPENVCPKIAPMEGSLVVLGYVIHRLLLLKYPYPSPMTPANLTKGEVAAVLIGVTEPQVITALEDLLTRRAIHMVTMENVINSCLDTYKKEAALISSIDLRLIQSTHSVMEELMSKKIIDKSSEKLKVDDGNEANIQPGASFELKTENLSLTKDIDEPQEPTILDKQTQTPKNVPEEDEIIPPSEKAVLGRLAFESLSLGQEINDEVLIGMLVEYLKDTNDIKGWVTLDYPHTYNQIALLEEKLTGLKVPQIIEEEESIELDEGSRYRKIDIDESSCEVDSNKRISKLLPNPIPKPIPEEFKTYFTAYINTRKRSSLDITAETLNVEFCDENTSPLDYLYANEGINYSFYYRHFDFPTVKKLAKLIIGDFELPLKSSYELFGGDVDDIEISFSPDMKRNKKSLSKKKVPAKDKRVSKQQLSKIPEGEVTKSSQSLLRSSELDPSKLKTKKGKKESSDKIVNSETVDSKNGRKGSVKSNQGKTSKTDIEYGIEAEDQGISKRTSIDEDPNKDIEEVIVEVEIIPPKPGEEGWKYIDLDLPTEIQLALATMWENTESVYLKDWKEVFFLKRVHNNTLIPYFNFILHNVRSFIRRPDNKQAAVQDFQMRYNDIEEDLRQDVEMKSELHCRVNELQHFLWNECDSRKQAAEEERQRLISEGWLTIELCLLANVFLSGSQLELDRCVDTAQLLHDYYLSMLGKLPSEIRLEKTTVPHIDLENFEVETSESNDVMTEPKEIKPKRGKSSCSERPISGVNVKDAIAQMLINIEDDRNIQTPFHKFVTDAINTICVQVEGLETSFKDIIAREEVALNSNKRGSKSPKKKELKEAKGKKKDKGVTEKPPEPPKELSVTELLLSEWTAALHDEVSRAVYRLQLICARALMDLSELFNRIQELFYRLHNEIGERYEREVMSVDQLCNVLCVAIEEEVLIQKELVLQDDEFLVRTDRVLYPDPPPPPPPPLIERLLGSEFRVQQLDLLMKKMFRMAPYGCMPERSFVYILEDLVACSVYEGNVRVLPQGWMELIPADLQFLAESIFGNTGLIDWKDFLIYGLDVRYPTQREILETRDAFMVFDSKMKETIKYSDYMEVELWFEKPISENEQQNLRITLAKQFLFSLFQVGTNFTNYTALLLGFCKDSNPIEGLAKGLALTTGHRVIVGNEDLEERRLEEEDIAHDILLVEAQEAAELAIEDLLELSIQKTEGVNIEEVFDHSSSVSETHTNISSVASVEQANMDLKVESSEQIKETPTNVSSVASDLKVESSEQMKATPPPRIRYPWLEHLAFDAVLGLLCAVLPGPARIPPFVFGGSTTLTEALEGAYHDLGSKDETVPSMDLFKHPMIHALLSTTYKFSVCHLNEVVQRVIMKRVNAEKMLGS